MSPFGNPPGWCNHLNVGLIDVLAPSPRHFNIQTVASNLAGKFRWCGLATRSGRYITVAQHCVAVADAAMYLGQHNVCHLRTLALLHELDEVFLPDIPTPLKAAFGAGVAALRAQHFRAGCERCGLDPNDPLWGEVKELDRDCAEEEYRALLSTGIVRNTHFAAHDFTRPWSPKVAREVFLTEARNLGIG